MLVTQRTSTLELARQRVCSSSTSACHAAITMSYGPPQCTGCMLQLQASVPPCWPIGHVCLGWTSVDCDALTGSLQFANRHLTWIRRQPESSSRQLANHPLQEQASACAPVSWEAVVPPLPRQAFRPHPHAWPPLGRSHLSPVGVPSQWEQTIDEKTVALKIVRDPDEEYKLLTERSAAFTRHTPTPCNE